jgi:hypothetical protein
MQILRPMTDGDLQEIAAYRVEMGPCRLPDPSVAHARARERVMPISELVFGTLTQNRSSLEPARRALRTAVPFGVDFANGRWDGITLSSGMRLEIFGVQFADGRRDHRPAWCATTF